MLRPSTKLLGMAGLGGPLHRFPEPPIAIVRATSLKRRARHEGKARTRHDGFLPNQAPTWCDSQPQGRSPGGPNSAGHGIDPDATPQEELEPRCQIGPPKRRSDPPGGHFEANGGPPAFAASRATTSAGPGPPSEACPPALFACLMAHDVGSRPAQVANGL
jgi:hypothetical protein